MSSIKWSAVAVLALLLTVAGLTWGMLHYHSKAVTAQTSVKQLQSETATQTAIISTQALSFQRANEIASTAQQYTATITGNAQEKEIEYRTILKKQPTCSLPVPADISGRLLDYANSLRSSAMHSDTVKSDSASPATAAPGTMTYCQAVLWIDPLLTAIDQANNQLSAIRKIELTRQGK